MSETGPLSQAVFARNARVIAGGAVSLNRLVEPRIAFRRGRGARIWDVDGREYVDYHGAFGPHILGHNDPDINAAVVAVLQQETSLFGSGTTEMEGELAELLVAAVPSMERVQLTNSGSEATYHALRIARAHTGREHIVVIQGGYNGWHNEVAVNLMTPLEELGPRVSPGEYPLVPLSAGIPHGVFDRVHAVNFNDAPSVEYVLRRHPVAAVLLEPVLQNIGVLPPQPGYLEELRALCTRHGTILIFDEVKTGFRAAFGGYQRVCGVRPDLTVLGKAVANGFPLAVIGGRADLMACFHATEPQQRVMIAGTYNGHPVSVAAAIATLRKLRAGGDPMYHTMAAHTQALAAGLCAQAAEFSLPCVVSTCGSAFCQYFMDHVPVDWHDLARHHDFALDTAFRRALIELGVYHFPVHCKQGSVSAAHTAEHVQWTVDCFGAALRSVRASRGAP